MNVLTSSIDALEQSISETGGSIGTGVLTVNQNSVSAGTFGANATEDGTINIVAPDWDVAENAKGGILNKPTIATAQTDITNATSTDTKELPTTYAVQQYVTGAISTQSTTDAATYQSKSTAADENKVANGAGGWKALGTTLNTTDAGYDANNAVTAGTIAAALAANQQATTYTPGTNVQIVNNEISATDTTYTAGSNITISGENNAIAATTGAVADAVTTLVTGDAVYDYVQSQTGGNVIPSMPNTCTATAPCALVTVNGTPSWQPIAQAEASVGNGN